MRRRSLGMLIVVIALSGCAHSDEWTPGDTKLYIAYAAAGALDTRSTQRFQYHPGIIEKNPMVAHTLGENPASSDLWQAYVSIAITNYFIARALPSEWRKAYLGTWAAGHGIAWAHNCKWLHRHDDRCY